MSTRQAAAMETLDAFREFTPDGYSEWLGAASAYRVSNLHAQALDAYREAQRIAPTDLDDRLARSGAALTRHDLGETCAAAAAFGELVDTSAQATEDVAFLAEYRAKLADQGRSVEVVRLNCGLRDAVEDDDDEAVAAFIGRGADVNDSTVGGRTPLHEAASRKSASTVALLLGHGATHEVDGAGWSPLHFALAERVDIDHADSPGVVARLLLARGARADAVTDLVGWTPLHLAAGLDDPETVRELIEAGADPNARTRVGGWTPLYIAERARNAVVAAVLQAAGAERGPSLEMGIMVYAEGDGRTWEDLAADSEYGSVFAMPRFGAGGRSVSGSFSASGAAERLVFETLGFGLAVTGFIDRHGKAQVLWVGDSLVEFLGVCRDPVTRLDHAMFEHGHLAGCCGPALEFWHWTASDRTFAKAHDLERQSDEELDRWRSSAWPTPSGDCRWREHRVAMGAFADALPVLQVGETPDFRSPEPIVLPSRVIPSDTVASTLAVMRTLPRDIVALTEGVTYADGSDFQVPLTSPRWEIVAIRGVGRGRDGDFGTDGILLVHDKPADVWRSVYDGGVDLLGLEDDALSITTPGFLAVIDLRTLVIGR